MFGRHVVRGAEDRAGAGQATLGAGRHLGDAEVQDLDEVFFAAAGDQVDVVGLQVAMNDARSMSGRQALGELAGETDQALHRDRRAAPDNARERVSFEELHHEVGAAVGQETEVADVDDVLVADSRGGPRFVQETLGHFFVASQVCPQHFHRDLLADDRVNAAVDDAHPAFADDALDAVASIDGGADVRIRPLLFRRNSRDLTGLGLEVHDRRSDHRDQLERRLLDGRGSGGRLGWGAGRSSVDAVTHAGEGPRKATRGSNLTPLFTG